MMRQTETEPLYFYTSKFAFLTLIPGLICFIGGVLVTNWGFREDNWGIVGLGILIMLIFIYTIPLLKRILTKKPYIILTKHSLTINQPFKGTVIIDWQDIREFKLEIVQMSRLVFIMFDLDKEALYQEEVSKQQFLRRKPRSLLGFSPFWIVWRQVKKSDRDILMQELDRLNNERSKFSKSLSEQINEFTGQLQAYKQKNKNYFLKAYGYSLFLTIAAFFITNLDNGSSAYTYLIVSFLIFPFAKMLFDEMIGSNISFLLKKENVTYIDYYLFPLMILVYGLLYMFSLFIAPIGFLYFILKKLYYYLKSK